MVVEKTKGKSTNEVFKEKFERVVVQSQKLSGSTLERKSVHLGGGMVCSPRASTSEGQEISGRFRRDKTLTESRVQSQSSFGISRK